MKRQIMAALLLMLTLLFFLAAVRQEKQLLPFQERLAYLYESSGAKVSSAEAYASQEENFTGNGNGMSVVWWTEKDNTRLTNPYLGTEAAVPVIAVCGRTDLLFPDAPTLDYDQINGCILGSHTASMLFGGRNVKGLVIEYQGERYRVAGVLDNIEDAFVYQSGREEELAFSRVTVRSGSPDVKAIMKNKIKELLQPEQMLDYDLLIFFAQLTLLLVPLSMGIYLLALVFRFAKDGQNRLSEKIFWWAVFCGFLLLLLKLIAVHMDVPTEFLPSKWSDFDFWFRLWEEKRKALALLMQQKKTPAEILFFIPYGKTILYGILAWLCLIHGKTLLKVEKENGNGKDLLRKHWKNLWKKHRSRERFQSGN